LDDNGTFGVAIFPREVRGVPSESEMFSTGLPLLAQISSTLTWCFGPGASRGLLPAARRKVSSCTDNIATGDPEDTVPNLYFATSIPASHPSDRKDAERGGRGAPKNYDLLVLILMICSKNKEHSHGSLWVQGSYIGLRIPQGKKGEGGRLIFPHLFWSP
jgi:hypothetical protein